MPDYHRAWHSVGTHLFIVNRLQLHGNILLAEHIELPRCAVETVRRRHPFYIHGWVALPDHLHCVLKLPSGNANFGIRWRLIMLGFSKTADAETVIARAGRADGIESVFSYSDWCSAQCAALIAPYVLRAVGLNRGLCAIFLPYQTQCDQSLVTKPDIGHSEHHALHRSACSR